MADHVDPKRRSKIMAKVRTEHTGPEIKVRKLLHRLGYRFRLHAANLPGKPDIVFPARRKAIFVHGCFWHGHRCRWGKLPKTRLEYWAPKISANRARDAAQRTALRRLGWRVLLVWQCEARDATSLGNKLQAFLES